MANSSFAFWNFLELKIYTYLVCGYLNHRCGTCRSGGPTVCLYATPFLREGIGGTQGGEGWQQNEGNRWSGYAFENMTCIILWKE